MCIPVNVTADSGDCDRWRFCIHCGHFDADPGLLLFLLQSGYQPGGEVVEPPMPILGFVLFSGRTIWVTEGGSPHRLPETRALLYLALS